jgi:hypothetical protein
VLPILTVLALSALSLSEERVRERCSAISPRTEHTAIAMQSCAIWRCTSPGDAAFQTAFADLSSDKER